MSKYEGVVIRVAYVARKAEHDHVTVLLADGSHVDCYRCQVREVVHRLDRLWGR